MAQVRMTMPEVDLEDEDRLYTEEGAAQFLRVTTRSLQNWRTRPHGPMGPPYVRISSRCIRYRRRDLIAWAKGRLRNSPQEEDGRALTPQSPGAAEGERLGSMTTADELEPDVVREESSVAPELEDAPAQSDAAAPPATRQTPPAQANPAPVAKPAQAEPAPRRLRSASGTRSTLST